MLSLMKLIVLFLSLSLVSCLEQYWCVMFLENVAYFVSVIAFGLIIVIIVSK